jgi:chorismate mutase
MENIKSFNQTGETNEPHLTKEQTALAKDELVKSVDVFPRINRRFVDPQVPGEPKFALFSYIDTPDEDMNKFLKEIKSSLSDDQLEKLEKLQNRTHIVKGVAKIRGAYHTQQDATQRAEEIVREIDSTNSIFTCIIGAPFPLIPVGMAEETIEVNLQDKTEQAIGQNVRNKRLKDKKEMDEINRREEELRSNAAKDPNAEDVENYIAHRVKLAHLRYAIEQHVVKRAECVENEKACVKWLIEMKNKNPEFEEKYMEKYMDARKKAHIPDDQTPDGFMKYMNDPLIKLEEDVE